MRPFNALIRLIFQSIQIKRLKEQFIFFNDLSLWSESSFIEIQNMLTLFLKQMSFIKYSYIDVFLLPNVMTLMDSTQKACTEMFLGKRTIF